MSEIIDIADSVVTELNAAPNGTFDQSFTAVRSYLPRHDLDTLADLAVTVVPKSTTVQTSGRSTNQYTHEIDVAIQQKLRTPGDPANDEIDPLMELADRIGEFFRLRRLNASSNAAWVGTSREPVYAPEHLDQLRVFTAVVTLTYRTVR